MRKFYEFFAGGGMARAGLGGGWECMFANDFSPMKSAVYRDNWGDDHFHEGDVSAIQIGDLPGCADLIWASTPCQDLSLAGNAVGLGDPELTATRSGAFWPYWSLIERLRAEGRKPRIAVFENVVGALSSNDGGDFDIVATAFASAGYTFGALVVDARLFLPQSRPRLFVIGVDEGVPIPDAVRQLGPQVPWHTKALLNAFDRLPGDVRRSWAWWSLPIPMARRQDLIALMEDEPRGVEWHSPADTTRLIDQMSPANRAKLRQAQAIGRRQVGCIYRRTRADASGIGRVRAEIRFDGVAGCLRTPSGGSSRQTIMIVEGKTVRSRLLSPREAARLMGLPESYRLPDNYNDSYHLTGDGVAVPVVRHLARHLLEPLAGVTAKTQGMLPMPVPLRLT